MMPTVQILLPDGTRRVLRPGDIVGRMTSAALCLDDARVSEAHALVSLRGGELQLLSLRGRFSVGAGPVHELTLEEGQEILLAPGLALMVDRVDLPQAVLAIEGGGLSRQVLHGVCSLHAGQPRLSSRFDGDADAWLWSTGGGFKLRLPGGVATEVTPGPLLVGGRTFQIVQVNLESAAPTVAGAIGGALTIVANWDTVHVQPEGAPAVAFTGRQARLISELATCGAPVSWQSVSRALWPDLDDDNDLRRRWDVVLFRLRGRLKAGGVRPDLVRADGSGNFELFLHHGDRVVDNT